MPPHRPFALPFHPYAAAARRAGAIVAAALSLHAAAGALAAQAPPRSGEYRFPAITASALSGRRYSLPADFDGRANVVLVAFRREQQALVDTWLPAAQELASANADVRYYELPTISRGFTLLRPLIDRGMRGGIPDPAMRDATITLYTDVGAFRAALGLASDRTIYALLVDAAGVVRWRGEGAFTARQGAELARAASAVLAAPAAPQGATPGRAAPR